MAGRDSGGLVRDTLAMVLAGGQGERLYPLTKERAKPAVPFGGIYKVIDFTLSNCLNSDLRRVYLLTQYNSTSLDHHVRLGWNILNIELGEYIYTIPPQQRSASSWYRGTADAIYQNVYLLQRERPARVLVLAGDHIYKMDYSRMLRFHDEAGAEVTVGCVEVPIERASGLGIAEIDGEQRITRFVEKPSVPQSLPDKPRRALASMGIYVFNTDTLVRSVADDAKRETAHDFGRNIIPALVARDRAYAYSLRDANRNAASVYWRDIGHIDGYWEANMELVGPRPEFDLHDREWPVRTYQEPHPPVQLAFSDRSETPRPNAILASGTIVHDAYLDRCVCSYGVRIEPDVELSECVLMEEVVVRRGARLRRAIVGRDVEIPAHDRIGFDVDADRRRFSVSPNGVTTVPDGMPL